MATKNNEGDIYVSIPADDTTIQSSPPVATSYAYYVIPQEPRRQKQCGGGCCCCAIVLGLLLFFLIPREPSVNYQYLAYNGPAPDGSGALTNVSASDFVGRYKFENMNYYSVEWSKLNMVNYWLTATTTNGCDIQQTKWGVQYCGKTMGSYEKDSAFTTGARTRSYQNVPLTSEQGSGDLVNLGGMLTECFYYGNVLVMSKGHVNEKTGLHDFGKVSIDDQYFWLVCN
mmetsp:Transcript_19774/g.35789  ORF Transcript_19774/g.35789 Transcript_19774/m.35789 type:complete len:228 (+) Transcript_19774:68-751(+)|eukprot:CAMPEP_0205904626 /NCGR_PEP_ID=MMETSP1325-20131115/842_1 /ASSEMBLY_ACC=CAM_ASM_000708 /TAXON_ID=236786 /ORGANISM="Florenciella sp., Strain RCC1007" /LENGTH=227 /DNA_ID=CAMNT_0053270433 /DNA_START=59 /DNA_END=742 /DNA_ORIENTATION=+